MKRDLEQFIRLLTEGKYDNKQARIRFKMLCDFYPIDYNTKFRIENLIKTFTIKF